MQADAVNLLKYSPSRFYGRVAADALKYGATATGSSTLLADFGALLASGDGSDCTLRLASGVDTPAHRVILCARSPVFKAQLEGALASGSSGSTLISLPEEVSETTLRCLLRHIYVADGLPPDASAEETQNILCAADMMGLMGLVRLSERRLMATLAADKAAQTLILADQHSCAALKDTALLYIAKHSAAVMRTDGWSELSAMKRRASVPTLADEVLFTAANGRTPCAGELGGAL